MKPVTVKQQLCKVVIWGILKEVLLFMYLILPYHQQQHEISKCFVQATNNYFIFWEEGGVGTTK